ncbi:MULTISPECIES: hypothetical protein [unclassified Myroides]|uniref:hypothetical protein n=1 Tax=unclassified Myroides TaxID=2642485 RepID=UPI003D2F88AE
MKTIKITSLVVCLLLGVSTTKVMGQEIEFAVLGGLTGSKKPSMSLSDGQTFGFSALYLHPIKDNLSFGAGLEFGAYSVTKELNNYKGAISSIDGQGDAFEFRYAMAKFKEDLKGNYLSIPLKIQYEGPTLGSENLRLYAAVGLKYQLYFKANSKRNLEDLQTSGYYPQWDAELFGPKGVGFGKLGDKSEEEKLKLNNGFFVLGEVGVKYTLSEDQSLYIGIYGDCDLGGTNKENTALLTYKNGEKINSVLGGEQESYKLRLFTLGIKLKYSFDL